MALNVMANPNFGVVDIDPIAVAQVLEAFVHRGSKLTGVSLDDISTGVTELPADNANIDLDWLLTHGMKLFDAIVWLTAGRPRSHPLVIDSSITTTSIKSLHEIARCVFYVYFFLLTQARYPASERDDRKPAVANFLRTIMGMDAPQHEYIEALCTFTPSKFDPVWMRNVAFVGMGQETLSRFGLGVAGYRLAGPFRLYEPKSPVPANLRDAVTFAKTLASTPPTWDIHPITRNPEILKKRGNLNKNLGNLIRAVYSAEEIAEMVAAKVLYAAPLDEKSHREYLSWGPIDDISGGTPIFRNNRV